MSATFECKFDECGAIFQFNLSMSKYESVGSYKKGCEFSKNDVCLSLFFTGDDGSDKPVPAEEGIPLIGDNCLFDRYDSVHDPRSDQWEHSSKRAFSFESRQFWYWRLGYEHCASEYKNAKTLCSRAVYIFTSVDFQSKKLENKTLVFVQLQMDARKKLTGQSRWSQHETFPWNIQSQFEVEEKPKNFSKNFVEVLKKLMFLAKAQSSLTRPKLPDSEKWSYFWKNFSCSCAYNAYNILVAIIPVYKNKSSPISGNRRLLKQGPTKTNGWLHWHGPNVYRNEYKNSNEKWNSRLPGLFSAHKL